MLIREGGASDRGAIEIKDRVQISAETLDVFLTDRRTSSGMILQDRRQAWRIYDDLIKAGHSAFIVGFTCVSECA